MTSVYLALGTNVGDASAQLDSAIRLLAKHIDDLVESRRYESAAVGYTDQPTFTNSVVTGHTNLSPRSLLKFVKETERSVGRIHRFRWGPREIDIDIILYGDSVISDPDLVVPHERFAERDFVLRPLLDLEPGLIDPRSNTPIQTIYGNLPKQNRSISDTTV